MDLTKRRTLPGDVALADMMIKQGANKEACPFGMLLAKITV